MFSTISWERQSPDWLSPRRHISHIHHFPLSLSHFPIRVAKWGYDVGAIAASSRAAAEKFS
jgi:hypothetical protein